jgi:phosphonoacetaldehyde hydrolase
MTAAYGESQDMSFKHLKAVVLDWAGTTVDFGSLAPVAALQRTFSENGVAITLAEAREHMGLLKKDQIRNICSLERVRAEWARVHGQPPSEQDVGRLFEVFVPRQNEILAAYSEPIPGVAETVAAWRASGLRIGSTTGYTRELLDVVISVAARHGYAPDASVTPDEAGSGRPKPFMCYQNAILLEVYPLSACVKIGDTPVDIDEGRNAGMWTIGITATGNEVGLARSDWESLGPDEQRNAEQQAAERLLHRGANYVAASLAACGPMLEDIDRRLGAGERP